jgi:hypothetical protein
MSEKDLILFVIATQVTILRRLDYLESKIENKEVTTHEDTIKEIVSKIESNQKRINEKLLKDFKAR